MNTAVKTVEFAKDQQDLTVFTIKVVIINAELNRVYCCCFDIVVRTVELSSGFCLKCCLPSSSSQDLPSSSYSLLKIHTRSISSTVKTSLLTADVHSRKPASGTHGGSAKLSAVSCLSPTKSKGRRPELCNAGFKLQGQEALLVLMLPL